MKYVIYVFYIQDCPYWCGAFIMLGIQLEGIISHMVL
jgi:hypothetical protein